MCHWVFTSTVATRVQLLQSCLTLCDPMDYSPPGSTVLGILQARILEWVATSSSRGSSWPRDRPASSVSPALQADSYHWGTREILSSAVAIVLENFSLKKTQVIQTRVFFFFPPSRSSGYWRRRWSAQGASELRITFRHSSNIHQKLLGDRQTEGSKSGQRQCPQRESQTWTREGKGLGPRLHEPEIPAWAWCCPG